MMRHRIIKIIMVLGLSITLLSGCDTRNHQVVVSCYPLQYLVETIAKDKVKCVKISDDTFIQRSQINDNYVNILENSDTFFYISSLEPYMVLYRDEFIELEVDMVDLSQKSAINYFKRYTKTYINNVETVVESNYYDGDCFNTIETYEKDPILWMDPVLMTAMANDVCDKLVKLYPEYQSFFEDNYASLELELAKLEADFQTLDDQDLDIKIVTMTPCFGNWQKAYGINVYPVILSKYGSLPSEEQLTIIKERILNDHVRYIAMENNLSKDVEALRERLINELGLIEVDIQNLSSVSKKDIEEGKNYLSMMYHNLDILEEIAQ